MAKVFIEETTLTNIGNAIRDKEGTSELIPVTDMATRIAAIDGGNAELPAEALYITGDCAYRFAKDGWNWFLNEYGNQVTTGNIHISQNMFTNCSNLYEIPFTINVDTYLLNNMFNACDKLKVCPKVRGNIQINSNTNLSQILYSTNLRDCEDLFDSSVFDGVKSFKVTSAYSAPKFNQMFGYCSSLRQVPSWYYKLRFSEESTAYPTTSYCLYRTAFTNCASLDEFLNCPVLRCNAEQTSDMFGNFIINCYRLKNFTFETDNGTPYVVKWKSQTLDLSTNIGTVPNSSEYIVTSGSGITADKKVTDDASYQALKNDPDWYTTNIQYTRYDHDSAVRTINSLPDTSAYLAEKGGTNTIKFQAEVGLKTDGGLINSLTEEEIAVAAAKGWTVTLV